MQSQYPGFQPLTNRTWIVIASRIGARFFEMGSVSRPLRKVEERSHVQGRAKNRDLGSDRPGRVFSSSSMNDRHGLSQKVLPTDKEADEFALEISQFLKKARGQNRFDHLILVAEPRFLGRMNGALDDQTSKCRLGQIDRNFESLPEHKLAAHLEPFITEILQLQRVAS